jgi:tetratricopeptide (TPR) repeat protein
MTAWRQAGVFSAFAAAALLAATLAVYAPYLNNPLIFDDATFFHGDRFHQAAVKPWEYGLRGLSYFTLAFTEVIFGQIRAHRLVSCALHALCAWGIFLLARDLLSDAAAQAAPGGGPVGLHASALIAALAFATHPVAVYGAGYLVQRSGVMALLFSLLCLRALRQGLLDRSAKAILVAALCYLLAVLSKEHAILLPLAAIPLAAALARLRGVPVMRLTGVFLALCVPIALLILTRRAEFVAAPYEPHLAELQEELFAPRTAASALETWFSSAAVQAGLFFKYALLWFWPDTSLMSIDLRVDFSEASGGFGAWAKLAAFTATGLGAGILLTRGNRAGAVAAFAVLYAWAMFLVEMGAIRFQEPFVLYRSYLWAPAYAILLALALQRLPPMLAIGLAVLAIPFLILAAYNRLDTFRSASALWNDAVAALPHAEVSGARRVFYNRGRALYLSGQYEAALRDAEVAVRLAPRSGPMRIARGAALLELGRLREAAHDFAAATTMSPEEQRSHILLARTLEMLGEHARADDAVRRAEALGHRGSVAWLQKFREQRTKSGAATGN